MTSLPMLFSSPSLKCNSTPKIPFSIQKNTRSISLFSHPISLPYHPFSLSLSKCKCICGTNVVNLNDYDSEEEGSKISDEDILKKMQKVFGDDLNLETLEMSKTAVIRAYGNQINQCTQKTNNAPNFSPNFIPYKVTKRNDQFPNILKDTVLTITYFPTYYEKAKNNNSKIKPRTDLSRSGFVGHNVHYDSQHSYLDKKGKSKNVDSKNVDKYVLLGFYYRLLKLGVDFEKLEKYMPSLDGGPDFLQWYLTFLKHGIFLGYDEFFYFNIFIRSFESFQIRESRILGLKKKCPSDSFKVKASDLVCMSKSAMSCIVCSKNSKYWMKELECCIDNSNNKLLAGQLTFASRLDDAENHKGEFGFDITRNIHFF